MRPAEIEPLSPFWSCMAGFLLVPLLSLAMLVSSAVLLCCWPFVPTLLYVHSRRRAK